MRWWRFALVLTAASLLPAQAPWARAADINDDVILGALVAEFHISVAASLLPDAAVTEDAIIGAVHLIQLTGITEPAGESEADLGKALDAFLAFAVTLDPAKAPPLSPELARVFACYLIGADPAGHAALGSVIGIDAPAATDCARLAAKASAHWNERLAPYRRGPGLTPPDGAGPLYVEIAPVLDAANEAIAEALRGNALYDGLAERLNAELALPFARMLLVTECGGPNTFFNPARREIVLCDERIAAWIAVVRKG